MSFLRAYCHAGQHWVWDGVAFDMMHPCTHYHSSNNRSCVLKITSGHHSVLLTGDIEKSVEKHLVKRLGSDLSAEVLVVPHHGSHTSSSQIFIQAVQPHYVLFPTGFLNRFHFPHPSIVRRYRHLSLSGGHRVVLKNTAYCGTITLKLKSNSYKSILNCYRDQDKHYWNDSLATLLGEN